MTKFNVYAQSFSSGDTVNRTFTSRADAEAEYRRLRSDGQYSVVNMQETPAPSAESGPGIIHAHDAMQPDAEI